MVRGTTSRMLFLDSSVNTHYDRTKINVPPHPFSAVGSERFSLSLQQFSIRRNWLNINPTNNTGYIYLDATYHEFTITPGVYATFAELSTALQTALNATANASIAKIANDGFTVAHSSVSRKFTIEIQMAARKRPKCRSGAWRSRAARCHRGCRLRVGSTTFTRFWVAGL